MISYESIARPHLDGICRLCRSEGWTSYAEPESVWQALTAPGVHSLVAVDKGQVVGAVQLLSDGAIQSYLAMLVVHPDYRRQGIGRRLIEEAFRHAGAKRIDLLATDEALPFYRSFAHKVMAGVRLYPSTATDDTNHGTS